MTDLEIESAKTALANDANGKPVVIVPGPKLTISESAEQLFKAVAPHKRLFQRAGRVFEVVQQGGDPVLSILEATAAQSRFEEYVQFAQWKTVKGTPILEAAVISKAVAEQYLSSGACSKLLPAISGVLSCPILVERNGKIHTVQSGYDETTGFYVAGGRVTIEVSVADAVVYLKKIMKDFNFVSGSDRSRALASLITPALKFGGFIKGSIPVDVAEANCSQAGKTYRQKIVAAVYNQRLAVITKKKWRCGFNG